jgi:diaminopimelate decarboxylase
VSFEYRNGVLHADDVPLPDLAERFGTPCYVYSQSALTTAYQEFTDALAGRDALVCYAVKANSNLAILSHFARLGAGFDIVSGGELARVLAAGGDPGKVVFSGVGKQADEMARALTAGILCFNVESAAELDRLEGVAASLGRAAPVSFRVNPDVDARTHPYISTGLKENKFGVAYDEAEALYRRAAASAHLSVVGIDCHIGSQLLDVAPFVEALDKLLFLVDRLAAAGISLHHIDIGGGLGIRYEDELPPTVAAYLAPVLSRLAGRKEQLIMEPGRRLVGNAGMLLTRVEYIKATEAKRFAIVDAAMNDLMRPALYDAWHEVLPVVAGGAPETCEIVGPVCESGDFLARGRSIAAKAGDLLAIMSAGAYGMTMSSNYNTRPRSAEVLVNGGQVHLARRRERVEHLFDLESPLPQ